MVHDGAEIDRQFARVVETLTERFAGVHDRDTVARTVEETRARLQAQARVTAYLPLLTSRHAAALLAGRETAVPHRPDPPLGPSLR
ncbi:MAG TPA: hypothetical protein VIT41_05880 [Microlunatus sp.]